MNDLVAFLRVCLDQDERVALDWQRHKQARTEQFMNDPRRKDVRLRRELVTDAQVVEYAYRDRFDPARVLREVESKRRIIDQHGHVESPDGWACRRCSDMSTNGDRARWSQFVPAPCPTIRLLAAPYEDEDGRKESWEP